MGDQDDIERRRSIRREIAAIRRRLDEGIEGAEDWCAEALLDALRDARDDVEFLLRRVDETPDDAAARTVHEQGSDQAVHYTNTMDDAVAYCGAAGGGLTSCSSAVTCRACLRMRPRSVTPPYVDAPAPAARKCPECNGYGDDGDALCQTCGGTRLAPAPAAVADAGAVSEGDVERYGRVYTDAWNACDTDRGEVAHRAATRAAVAAIRAEATPPVTASMADALAYLVTYSGSLLFLAKQVAVQVPLSAADVEARLATLQSEARDGALVASSKPAPPVDLAALRAAGHRMRTMRVESLNEQHDLEQAFIAEALRVLDATGGVLASYRDPRTPPAEPVPDEPLANAHRGVWGSVPQEPVDLAALRDAVEAHFEEETDATATRVLREARRLVDAPPPDAAGACGYAEAPVAYADTVDGPLRIDSDEAPAEPVRAPSQPPPWNTCPSCGAVTDIGDDAHDGSEVRCHRCQRVIVVTEYADGTFALDEQDETNDEEGGRHG